MKRVLTTICLVALLVGGCHHVGFLGGSGGESGSANFTIESGSIVEDRPADPNWLMVSTGITIIAHDIAPIETCAYLKFGFELVPDSGLFVDVLGGMTFRNEFNGYTRPDGTWKKEPTELNIDGMIGGGITYFLNDGGTAIIASYDNKRGLSAGVGFRY